VPHRIAACLLGIRPSHPPPPLIAGLAANALQDDGALALAAALEVHPALRLLDAASAQCVSQGALSSQPGGGGAGPQNPGSFGAQSFRLTLHQPALSTRPGIFLEGASLQVTFWAPSANPAKPWFPYRPRKSAAHRTSIRLECLFCRFEW